MSTFQVQPSTPYNIAIGAPGVSGAPTPTVSYAWTYNGTAIGGNSRFVNGYTFPSLPGTLACTITLTNIVGSVSETVSATIEQVSNLPSLSPVTIRNNAAPTVPISTIANGSAGVVLRVGGPSAPDINPVSTNASNITYQWRRDAADVAGATSQTYTLVEADEDSQITVVVTASNPDGQVSRVASLSVGDALPNANSHIGSHAHGQGWVESNVPFVNLIYSTVGAGVSLGAAGGLPPGTIAGLVHGLSGQGVDNFGEARFDNWTGDPYYTVDGWPFRSDSGALSVSNPVQIALSFPSALRMWSILGLPGTIQDSIVANLNDNGDAVWNPKPAGISGRTLTYSVDCYWEGTGVAVGEEPNRNRILPKNQWDIQTVQFAGPDGEGPFGDGPRTMKRSRASRNVTGDSPGLLRVYIAESDVTGVDPLKNLMVMISDVRDATTGELIYAGFDHTTYKPFQLYPQWAEANQHMTLIRSLQNQLARTSPDPRQLIHTDTGLTFEWQLPEHGSTYLLKTGWTHPAPRPPGFEGGFAAINRPTHAGFGFSLRALIEICNQLNADLWWCHPAPTAFVGTQNEDGTIRYARQRGEDPGNMDQVGEIMVDEDYLDGFVNEIETHLKPGLKVYSEWVNEVWNTGSWYIWATRYAWTCAWRAKAPVEHGGDGGMWYAYRTLESPAIHAGTVLEKSDSYAMTGFAAAANALLVRGMRERLAEAQSNREIVCVAASQSKWMARAAGGIGQFWAAMPKLFREVDAVSPASYRNWWGDGVEQDALLVSLGADGAWQYNVDVKGTQTSYADFETLQLEQGSFWNSAANLTYPHFLKWKRFALDEPQNGYERLYVPPGWPADQRRWNLKLVGYEGGNHHAPNSSGARLESFRGTTHPAYGTFMLRYMEALFAHGPKGLARDPATSAEEALYRPGMVPLTVLEDAEPLHDVFTFIMNITEPSYRSGQFWGLQWWNGHGGSAQGEGVRDAVNLGIGTPNWWLSYSGGSE